MSVNHALTAAAHAAAEADLWELTPEDLDTIANNDCESIAAVNAEICELLALAGFDNEARSITTNRVNTTAAEAAEHLTDMIATAPSEEKSLEVNTEFCPLTQIRSGLTVADVDSYVGRIDYITGCGRWSCGVCGPRKRWKLIRRILLKSPNKFLTLTTLPSGSESPRDVFERTSPKVGEFFRELKKQHGPIPYVRILESTERGFPHYHFCIVAPYLHQPKLSALWERLTGAKIVDIRQLKGKTINYVSKYVTKHDHVSYTRQRVSFSRDWPKLPKSESDVDLAEWSTTHNEEIPEYVSRLAADSRAIDLGRSSIGITTENNTSQLVAALAAQFGQSQHVVKYRQTADYVLNAGIKLARKLTAENASENHAQPNIRNIPSHCTEKSSE